MARALAAPPLPQEALLVPLQRSGLAAAHAPNAVAPRRRHRFGTLQNCTSPLDDEAEEGDQRLMLALGFAQHSPKLAGPHV